MKFSYEPPRAIIWKASDLDKIEAEMTYGSSSWPSHGDGSQYSPIKMNMGKAHRGSAAKCWLTFDTCGSYDIECSAYSSYIRIYDSFRNAPLNTINTGNGACFRSFGCYGKVTRFVLIESGNGSAVNHYFFVGQHLDTHYFDKNAGGAYWIPQSNKYRADPDIAPSRVIYLPGSGVDAIYRLIKDNPSYGNAKNFFDCLDSVLGEIMEWGAGTNKVVAFAAAMGLRAIVNLADVKSAQQVIDEIKSKRATYSKGIRAEETINVYVPKCACEPWNGTDIMRGIAGSIGDWHYFTPEELQ